MRFRLGRYLLALFVGAVGATAAHAQLNQSFTGDFDIPDLSQYSHKLEGSAFFENGQAVLTPSLGSQLGGIFFDQLTEGGWSSAVIEFDLLMSQPANSGADGFGFAMLPVATYGATKDSNPGFSEEVNLPGTFGVGFDTYFNDGFDPPGLVNAVGENSSSISVHWDGAVINNIAGTSTDPNFNFETGNPAGDNYRVNLFISSDGNDGNLTMTITDLNTNEQFIPIISQTIPGMTNYEYRLGFWARTGGAWNRQAFENLSINQDGLLIEPELAPIPPVMATLVGGTNYSVETNHANAGQHGDLWNADAASGVQDGYLRLTQEAGGHVSRVAFDRVGPENVRVAFAGRTGGEMDEYSIDNVQGQFDVGRATVSFDFRGLGNDNTRADGLGVLLVDTDLHGDSGILYQADGTTPETFAGENPGLRGALGIGFDTYEPPGDPVGPLPPGYQGNPANVGNHARIYFNGQELGRVVFPISEFDIVNDVWNHAMLSATQISDTELLVQMQVIDGTDGQVIDVWPGGVTVNAPVGSLFSAVYVPEPSTGILILGSLALLGLGRRRS